MMRMILFCLTFHFISATNTTTHHVYHADSHLQGLFYQKQAHAHAPNTTRSAHKAVLHHRVVHPRFRPLLQTRNTNKPTLPSTTPFLPFIELHPVNARTTTTTPTTINLLQILTFKPQTRKQSSFGEYFFQQQLRAFFGHQHDEQHSAPTRSNIKTGLR